MFRQFRKLHMNNETKPIIFIRNSFRKAFGKYLLLTNIVSSGTMLGIGDIVQQEIEYRQKIQPKRYDYERTGRMFLVGLGLGPMLHYFYKYLDRFIPKTDVKSVGKKILLDQILAEPIIVVSFFGGMGFLEKQSFKEIKQEIRDKFLTIYMVDWLIWPPTQFINFYFINPKYRVLYISMVTVVYDVFLSYVKHKDHKNIPSLIVQK